MTLIGICPNCRTPVQVLKEKHDGAKLYWCPACRMRIFATHVSWRDSDVALVFSPKLEVAHGAPTKIMPELAVERKG